MAKIINIDVDEKRLIETLQKGVQSANLNFIIGAGCSFPALQVLGNVEKAIQDKIDTQKEDEAEKLIFEFLKPFWETTSSLVENKANQSLKITIDNYSTFLNAILKILYERKSNILFKQATIFSTNYDLFIEKAAEQFTNSFILNDGFKRTPSLNSTFIFSAREFFNSIYNTGNLYNYQVQVPAINLIKLHGSINWYVDNGKIIHSLDYLKIAKDLTTSTELDKICEFNKLFSVILPRIDKFKDSILNQTYYDLLRIFSNELDKENTLLFAEGVSFADGHILDLTLRALKNPTLKVIVFCFRKEELTEYEHKFSSYNNIEVVYSEKENVDFKKFIALISEIVSDKWYESDKKDGSEESDDE